MKLYLKIIIALLIIIIFGFSFYFYQKGKWIGTYSYKEINGEYTRNKWSDKYKFIFKRNCINWGDNLLKDKNNNRYICRHNCKEVIAHTYDLGSITGSGLTLKCEEEVRVPPIIRNNN